jgi:hypothetical protein
VSRGAAALLLSGSSAVGASIVGTSYRRPSRKSR